MYINICFYKGATHRSPGLMPYIEYLVDDIILKAKYRPYGAMINGEKNDPKATGQRWQLTARAVKILCIILQQYEINNIPLDEQFLQFLTTPTTTILKIKTIKTSTTAIIIIMKIK